MKTNQGVSSRDRKSKRLRWNSALLSPREEEISRLVTKGLTNKEIAVSLNIAVSTVNQFVNRLFLKTGVHNRTQLAVLATQVFEARRDVAGNGNARKKCAGA